MDIEGINLKLTNKTDIPRIDDEIEYEVDGVIKYGIVLSIDDVYYDERLRLNIEYRIKVIESRSKSKFHIVGRERWL